VSSLKRRVHEKIDDYDDYRFSTLQSTVLNIFFDLAQEFDSYRDLLVICVLIPKIFFDLDCSIFLYKDKKVEHITPCVRPGKNPELFQEAPFSIHPVSHLGCYYLPIKGNKDLQAQMPIMPEDNLIGMLGIHPDHRLGDHDRLFFEKYANRLGFQLHSRMIRDNIQEHLQFIRSLVKDIGHNVIVPNMYFKLFYRRLEGTIHAVHDLYTEMQAAHSFPLEQDHPQWQNFMTKLHYIHEGLEDQFGEIVRHYENTSLFLETLLRRSHFEQGRYVLEKKTCNFKKQIIDPQINRFAGQFQERGIEIALAGIPDLEIEAVVDIGLITQVYANLFSNAVKYTASVKDNKDRWVKFISYGWQEMPNFFGPGLDGIKLNVFTTGPHIPETERSRLFDEGFRASNSQKEPGTGRGLFFIKEIIELHGGRVGYESTPMGNNFYFILPKEAANLRPARNTT
jgi:signal transduction histidine kinase